MRQIIDSVESKPCRKDPLALSFFFFPSTKNKKGKKCELRVLARSILHSLRVCGMEAKKKGGGGDGLAAAAALVRPAAAAAAAGLISPCVCACVSSQGFLVGVREMKKKKLLVPPKKALKLNRPLSISSSSLSHFV